SMSGHEDPKDRHYDGGFARITSVCPTRLTWRQPGCSQAFRTFVSGGFREPTRPQSAANVEKCNRKNVGAGGGGRTLTGSEPHGILSPARLPVSPLRRGREV